MRVPGYLHQGPATQFQHRPHGSNEHTRPATDLLPTRRTEEGSFFEQSRIDLSHYESIRKEFHSNPELSGQEKGTAARIAHYLKKAGVLEIHTGIGGHGVAGVLKNGPGAKVLLRSDSDALPVKERTGLPYASTKRQVDDDGEEKPVMHACGHDVHITCLLATAESLVNRQKEWSGTVIFVFQPAEERLAGAKSMVKDGLYDKVPVPDILLGQHVIPDRAGRVGLRPGPFMAATDNFKITFYGRGAHASQPQSSIDPIVMASSAVLRLQTVVSREIAPLDAAVLTISAIHGGSAENVIEDEAYIRVNTRTFTEEVRANLLAAMERIVKAESQASGATKVPRIERTHAGPATLNDVNATRQLSNVFRKSFSDRFNSDHVALMGSEDFGDLATAINKPSVFWVFGGTDHAKYDDAVRRGRVTEEIPSNHSAFFAPVMRPTLDTGIEAMTTAALAFLKPE